MARSTTVPAAGNIARKSFAGEEKAKEEYYAEQLKKYGRLMVYSNKKKNGFYLIEPAEGGETIASRYTTDGGKGRLRISGSHKRILANKTDIRLGTVTVSKDTADHYFASFQLGSDTPFVEKFAKTGKQLGVDLNLDNFLTDSNGAMVANPRFYRKAKRQLAKAQRKLGKRCARAKKEGRSLRTAKNYQKQRLLVARLHDRIRNQRSDFINRLTTALVKSHDLVVAERLMSRNMAKNHALAMSITDAGWREFLAKMQVKADLYGKTFLMLDPKNTTQRCSSCGHIMGKNGTEKLTLKDREWTCPKCGTYHIRDWNAAKNILDKGLAKIAKEKPAKTA